MENPLLELVHRFIFKSRRRYFLLGLMALMIFKTGIGEPWNLKSIQPFVENPFVNPFLNQPDMQWAQYLLWNWLGPFLMWCLNLQSDNSIFLFYFAFSLLFSALFFYTAWKFLPDTLARTASVVFAIFPVSSTVYFWVCMDSLTLFLMLCPFACYRKNGGGGGSKP